jgi:hypothetical protein
MRYTTDDWAIKCQICGPKQKWPRAIPRRLAKMNIHVFDFDEKKIIFTDYMPGECIAGFRR